MSHSRIALHGLPEGETCLGIVSNTLKDAEGRRTATLQLDEWDIVLVHEEVCQLEQRCKQVREEIEYDLFLKTIPEEMLGEMFEDRLLGVWSVNKAQFLIHQAGREPFAASTERLASAYGFPFHKQAVPEQTPLPTDSGLYYVNIEKALTSPLINHQKPIILIQYRNQKNNVTLLLIDGLHRLYAAAWRGQLEILAYILSEEEGNLCQVRPGLVLPSSPVVRPD